MKAIVKFISICALLSSNASASKVFDLNDVSILLPKYTKVKQESFYLGLSKEGTIVDCKKERDLTPRSIPSFVGGEIIEGPSVNLTDSMVNRLIKDNLKIKKDTKKVLLPLKVLCNSGTEELFSQAFIKKVMSGKFQLVGIRIDPAFVINRGHGTAEVKQVRLIFESIDRASDDALHLLYNLDNSEFDELLISLKELKNIANNKKITEKLNLHPAFNEGVDPSIKKAFLEGLSSKILKPFTKSEKLVEIARSSIDIGNGRPNSFWWFFGTIVKTKDKIWSAKVIPSLNEKVSKQELIFDKNRKSIGTITGEKDNTFLLRYLKETLSSGYLDNRIRIKDGDCTGGPSGPGAVSFGNCEKIKTSFKVNNIVFDNLENNEETKEDEVKRVLNELSIVSSITDRPQNVIQLKNELDAQGTLIGTSNINDTINPANTDCISCHVSSVYRYRSGGESYRQYRGEDLLYKYNFDMLESSKVQYGKPSIDDRLIKFGSVRHFGSAVSQRTINETAIAADKMSEMYNKIKNQ